MPKSTPNLSIQTTKNYLTIYPQIQLPIYDLTKIHPLKLHQKPPTKLATNTQGTHNFKIYTNLKYLHLYHQNKMELLIFNQEQDNTRLITGVNVSGKTPSTIIQHKLTIYNPSKL